MRSPFLHPAALTVLSAFTTLASPNFLIIQCDDLGWDDLGLHNPLVSTPRLDALGRDSVRFSQFTVNPVCAPSRATFLTGRHFLRTGVSHVHGGKDFLHLDERTLADHLRAAGYATGMWGKWHSGFTEGYHPWQRGFDEAYSAQLYRHRATRGLLNGAEVAHDIWADAVLADHAIDFITRHRDRPWLAYVSTLTPHGPLDAPDAFIAPYLARGDLSPALATLWGMVSHLDHQVGRILDALDHLGLADNTVILFFSDNGPAFEGRSLTDADRAIRKVTGLRGWKGDLYENAVRSPLFLRWPARLAPRFIDTPIDHVDLTPTLLALAHATPVPDTPPLDGRSFAHLLHHPSAAPSPYLIFNYAHRGWLTSGPPYSLDGIPGEYLPIPRKTDIPVRCATLSRITDIPVRCAALSRKTDIPVRYAALSRITDIPVRYAALSRITDIPVRYPTTPETDKNVRSPHPALPFPAQSLSVREGPLKLVVNGDFTDAASPDAPRVALYDLAIDPRETTDLSATRPAERDRLLAALRAWWTDIVASPRAFQPPVLLVAADAPTTIPARAPAELEGGVFNTVTELKNWRAPGDTARWHLRLATPATVTLHPRWRTDLPPDTRFTLTVLDPVTRTALAPTVPLAPTSTLLLPAGDLLLELRLDSASPEPLPALLNLRLTPLRAPAPTKSRLESRL